MKTTPCLLLAFLVSALPACAPHQLDLMPDSEAIVIGRSATHVAALYRVPESGPGGLDVRVTSRGAVLHKRRRGGSVVVRTTVTIENRSERPATFFEGSTTLVDRDGVAAVPLWTPDVAAVVSGGAPEAPRSDSSLRRLAPVGLEPGERRTFSLSFRDDRTRDPRDVIPCTLHLELEESGHERTLDVRLVLDPSSAANYGYGYGWYPAYGAGYYGPGWYGPGFWGGPGFGYGYGYGWGPYF